MVYQDIGWVRNYRSKLCPALRKQVLNWYRSTGNIPCFVNSPLQKLRQKWQKIPVIVQLDEKFVGTGSPRSLAVSAGCRLKKDFPLIHAFCTDVNAKNLQALLQRPEIKKIWLDGKMRAVLDIASPTVGSPPLWEEGKTGKGIVIAVLDTGIYNHPDLRGRIVGFKDFVHNKETPYDDNGHGTHVSGCAAASGEASGGRYRGPAPEAELVGVKVLDKLGSGRMSGIIQGVQWCIDNKERYQVRILNLSLGSEAYLPYNEDPVCQAVEKAWERGLVVCAAAGNNGPEPGTVISPGIQPDIITVGAVDDRGTLTPHDDTIASFSSRSPSTQGLAKPDLVAPGVNIIAPRSPGSFTDKQQKKSRVEQWYASFSGTSMATPICAGLIAQLLELKGDLTPQEIKTLLINTARALPENEDKRGGAGVADVQKAAAVLLNPQGESPDSQAPTHHLIFS